MGRKKQQERNRMANGNYTVGGIAYDKENDRLVTKQTTT